MKIKYKLLNLTCANCANKIEQRLNNDKKLKNVHVNYANSTLSLETDDDKDLKNYLLQIIHEIEPDVDLQSSDSQINHEQNIIYHRIIRCLIGIIISIVGLILHSKIILLGSYIILLWGVMKKAITLLFKSLTIDENLLISISCFGAYFTNNIKEGLMVIILYEIGKVLESLAIKQSRKSITDLTDLKVDYANIKKNKTILKVEPTSVKIGDTIIVKKGEKIPLDGIITKGTTQLNMAALTGESKLKNVEVKDTVLSGSINVDDPIEVKVTELYVNSTVAKILDLVENASDRKAKAETFVAKAAKIYTPIVLLLAISVVILFPLLFHIDLQEAIYRGLTFLVISCPCAIAISVPLSYFSGLGTAAKKGILIKGSDYLDNFTDVNTIIFDKTGTITLGTNENYQLIILDKQYSKDDIIDYYLKGESFSNHPISSAIMNQFKKTIKADDVINFREYTGRGITYTINDKKIKIGSSKFCGNKQNDNAVYLKINQSIVAKLEHTDEVKKNVPKIIDQLKKQNIKVMMFTGDEKNVALDIAKKAHIDSQNVYYDLLPQDKYSLLEKQIKTNKKGKTCFIGDGINDAPSLMLADIGVSMGNIGSAIAIESSDIVFLNDDMAQLLSMMQVARRTKQIIKENLIFALGVKLFVLILSALGFASMWQAVFADTGVTLLTILNTGRILKSNQKHDS